MSLTVFAIAAVMVAAIAGLSLVAARQRQQNDAGLAEAEATVRAAMLTQEREPELPLAA
jgi:hypothetical protein